MPPRKKQKTATVSKPAETVPELPSNFPAARLLTRALQNHAKALTLRSNEHTKTPTELIELDAWLTGTLSTKIASAEPITKPDMTALMKWKLARGKSRPTLLSLIASNSDALVAESTSAALQIAREAEHDIERALIALPDACKMKGVGAATASALLTLQPPHTLPFMSDEAAAFFALTLGLIKYTDPFYRKFARAMGIAVARLNAEADGESWDAMKLERALWTLSILRKHGEEGILDDATTSGSLKRRRDDT